MESEYTKVYISLPRQFLEKLDVHAHNEHQSRSAFIREAVKYYMEWREMAPDQRFVRMANRLKGRVGDVSDETLGAEVDQAVAAVRQRRRAR